MRIPLSVLSPEDQFEFTKLELPNGDIVEIVYEEHGGHFEYAVLIPSIKKKPVPKSIDDLLTEVLKQDERVDLFFHACSQTDTRYDHLSTISTIFIHRIENIIQRDLLEHEVESLNQQLDKSYSQFKLDKAPIHDHLRWKWASSGWDVINTLWSILGWEICNNLLNKEGK